MRELRFIINNKRYSLIGSRWYTHDGTLITDKTTRILLFSLANWKNRAPIGSDLTSGGSGSGVTSINGLTGDVTFSDLGIIPTIWILTDESHSTSNMLVLTYN